MIQEMYLRVMQILRDSSHTGSFGEKFAAGEKA